MASPSAHSLLLFFGLSCAVFVPVEIKLSFCWAAMNQKVVLITGCSSGIGLALAVRIAKDEKKRFMGKVPSIKMPPLYSLAHMI